ncbi:unnamed protein product, partial [Callosobruchus maculatus]
MPTKREEKVEDNIFIVLSSGDRSLKSGVLV